MSAGTEAAHDFAASGAYDYEAADFIIDKLDAPTLPLLSQDDWIVYDNRKFQISKVGGVDKESWVVSTKELIGEAPQQTFDVKVEENLPLSETCDGQ